jgi:hypothetical protein
MGVKADDAQDFFLVERFMLKESHGEIVELRFVGA